MRLIVLIFLKINIVIVLKKEPFYDILMYCIRFFFDGQQRIMIKTKEI